MLPSVLGIKAALISGAVALLVGFGGGAYAGYRWEHGVVLQERLDAAKAQSKAVTAALEKQKKLGASGIEAGYRRGLSEGLQQSLTLKLVMGVPANVTLVQDQAAAASDHAGCITYGFVRLLVAGQRSVEPDTLALPAGQSIDACTGLAPSALAATLAADLGVAAQNASQLNDLIAEVRRQGAIIEEQPNERSRRPQ